jgi:hypothetical protein
MNRISALAILIFSDQEAEVLFFTSTFTSPIDDNSYRKPADEYINDSSGTLMFRFLIRQLTGYRAIRMVYLPVNFNFDIYHEEKGL